MRQGQQNRRGRGRGRKPQNPLARNYESNGPDVKIRGTAAHVAEKYMSLARDALASGDTIAAESYLQHAEHYNRIIMAAHSQAAAPQAGDQQQANGGAGRSRQAADENDDSDNEETVEPASAEAEAPSEGRSRGRGRQRRNGGHAAPEANATSEAHAAAEGHGTNEANGAEQTVDVGAAEETEGASGAVG